MLFSIVIPVYNVDNYIGSTIKSILEQTYDNYEIIIINDGSTDNSGFICNTFAKLDKRIKVIHKENEGVSSARNFGIEAARGEYLLFVDGDDLMCEDTLEKLFIFLNSKKVFPDIVFSNHNRFNSDKNYYEVYYCDYNIEKLEKCNNDELLIYLFDELSNFKCSVWSHIYRLDYIKYNNLYFDNELILSEDIDWMFRVIINSNHVTGFLESIYFYRTDNMSSVMHKPASIKKYISNHFFYTKWFDYFMNKYPVMDSNKIMSRFLASGYINSSIKVYDIDSIEEREEAIKLFKNGAEICKHAANIKYRMIYPIKLLLGDRVYLMFINKAHRFKRFLTC